MNRARRAPHQAPEGSLWAALEQVPDVRRDQGRVHPLVGMLAPGVDGWTLREIEREEISGVHLVAAFAQWTRVVLGQEETQGEGHAMARVKPCWRTPRTAGDEASPRARMRSS